MEELENQNTENEETQPAENETEETQATEETENSEATENKSDKYKRLYFYIAIACTALGALFFGLTFTPLAVYSLCAAILFCLASLSFLGTQKKKENFKWVTILTVITYVLLGIFVAFFIGGAIWSIVT